MSDLIDREEALKEIYNRYGSAYEWYLENGISGKELDFALTSYAECHVAIRNLPSVESTEPKWIPVTERLPEKRGFYLITTEKTHEVDICSWNGSRFEYYPNGCMVVLRPQAWMPLPEPYEGGDAE